MSKKQVPDNFMENLMEGKQDKHGTKAVQPTDEQSTNTVLKRYDVRLNPDDMKRMEEIGRKKGLSRSALIRMVLREYIDTLLSNR